MNPLFGREFPRTRRDERRALRVMGEVVKAPYLMTTWQLAPVITTALGVGLVPL